VTHHARCADLCEPRADVIRELTCDISSKEAVNALECHKSGSLVPLARRRAADNGGWADNRDREKRSSSRSSSLSRPSPTPALQPASPSIAHVDARVLADAIVCAACDASEVTPQIVRRILATAVARARELSSPLDGLDFAPR
jgi:hypothetical protein